MTRSVARYWKRVEWPSLTACWQWQGALARKGYGLFGSEFAHRIAYRIWHGEIPHGHFVCHRCDNPRCVNPFHLVAWTPAQNLADAIAKGRWTPRRNGTRNGQAKLNERAVRLIRTSTKPEAKLASRFGVTIYAIRKVRSGERWAHVRTAPRQPGNSRQGASGHPEAKQP